MAAEHLLPCSCGKSITIQPSQAGQTVHCECGEAQVAPKMRDIRRLPIAKPDETPRPRTSIDPRWATGVVGLAVTILASGLLLYTYLTWPTPRDVANASMSRYYMGDWLPSTYETFIPDVEKKYLALSQKSIDEASALQLWGTWYEMNSYMRPSGNFQQRYSFAVRTTTYWMLASTVLLVLGIATMVTSRFLPSPARRF